jgi:hypothetical protein
MLSRLEDSRRFANGFFLCVAGDFLKGGVDVFYDSVPIRNKRAVRRLFDCAGQLGQRPSARLRSVMSTKVTTDPTTSPPRRTG